MSGSGHEPGFKPHECRPGFEIRLHDAEAFLYPPPPFADPEYGGHIIVQKVGAYSIQPVIPGLFCNLVLVQIILDAGRLAVLCDSHLPDEPGRVVGVLPLRFPFPGGDHLLGALHLPPADLLLVGSIFGGVGDDQPLVQLLGRIGTVFIEETVLFLPDFRQFHWLVIRQPSEAAAVERPLPVLRGQFFDGLGHDERPFPHMVEFPVPFRTQACIAAVDEPGVAESLQDYLFQGLQGLLFVLVPREDGKGQGDAA